jgi:hypothetical protein
MNQYYRAVVKTQFEDRKGNIKFKKENYVVFAVSPTDVEAKMAKHLQTSDYEIISISLMGIVEVIK